MLNFEPLPPKEAYAFWLGKVPMKLKDFDKLTEEAQSQAFTVAGLSKLSQISGVHKEIGKAINEGKSFGQFKKDVLQVLSENWRENSYRLETIYRTNMQSAYQAGRYSQMMSVADRVPYWRYVAVGDGRTRKDHLALAQNNIIRRFDDPFWNTFYPPNGYRCRCSVQALSERQIKKRGLKVGEGLPERLVYKDMETGFEYPVVPAPGKGFTTPPNQMFAAMFESLTNKLEKLPVKTAQAFVASSAHTKNFEAWQDSPAGEYPIAVMGDDHAGMIGASVKTVQLSKETFTKQLKRHPELGAAEYLKVQNTIKKGKVVQDGKKSLIYILDDVQGYVTVVKATKTGKAIFLTSFRRLSKNEAKKDKEIARLLKKER